MRDNFELMRALAIGCLGAAACLVVAQVVKLV